MDFAYDHITEENLPQHQASKKEDDRSQTPTQSSTSHNRQQSLSSEFDEAYKTIQGTVWGARFGSIFETVKKQSEAYYDATKTEYATRSEQAQKGWTGLREAVVTRSRALSTDEPPSSIPEGEETGESSAAGEKAAGKKAENEASAAQTAGTLLSRLREEAMKGITEVQKAEDAADAYLAKFGANLGNFLKDAVTIAPPSDSDEERPAEKGKEKKDVLFETKGSDDNKRPIHTTRLDAQLHLLHSNLDNFQSDPKSPKYKSEWASTFSAEKKTDQITKDLDQYPELRASMEKLVPGTVSYEEFWKRYYFLRGELDAEEQKRKELLKVAAKEEEEVGWEEDSDEDEDDDDEDEEDESEEEESSEEDTKKPAAATGKPIPKPAQKQSTDTLRAKSKPADIMSQPDSEASYDLVSGAPSNASGSPPKQQSKQQDDSDEEDWE